MRALPALLRDEPALASILGKPNAVLAVPEPARAIAIAGLARQTERHPIVVAVPTTGDAERLVHDLGAFLGEECVDFFPAWETLPFERVSPSVETMGRRLRTMWHLLNDQGTRVIVAPVRALVQRLGPHVEEIEMRLGPAGPLFEIAFRKWLADSVRQEVTEIKRLMEAGERGRPSGIKP